MHINLINLHKLLRDSKIELDVDASLLNCVSMSHPDQLLEIQTEHESITISTIDAINCLESKGFVVQDIYSCIRGIKFDSPLS